ncbi:MAG: tetratricopeptide repeat protein [Blastochloris sp.]|nr:tetratricopeptide repeat protein [Blastochloris sp.]
MAQVEEKLELAQSILRFKSSSYAQNGHSDIPENNTEVYSRQIDIVLTGSFDDLTPDVEQATIRALAAIANISPEQIKVIKVMPGSIVFRVEIPATAAELLESLSATGNPLLAELGVRSILQVSEIEKLVQEGKGYIISGLFERARLSFEKALEISRNLGDPSQEPYILNQLGALDVYRNSLLQAQRYYEQALRMSRQLNNIQQEITSLNGLGKALALLNNLEGARQYFDKALEFSKSHNDKRREIIALSGIGSVYALKGNFCQLNSFFALL